MLFGLVALWDVTRCAAMSNEELVKRGLGRRELVLEVLHELIRERRILAPGHDVVVKNISVGEQHLAFGQIERVNLGDVGIVIAGEELDGCGVCLGEAREIGATLIDRIMIGLRASVGRIAVADQTSGVVSEGRELFQSMHGAGAITVVNIGNDA